MPGVTKSGGVIGYRGLVTSEGAVITAAVTEPSDRHLNRENNQVWTLPIAAIDPVGAGDNFFYLKNTGIETFGLTDFRFESTVAGTITMFGATGTPINASLVTVVPVSRVIGGTGAPVATIYTDTDLTGVTSMGTLFYQTLDTVNTQYRLSTTSNIIVPPGQQFVMQWSAATGILKGVVSLVQLIKGQ